MASWVAYLLSLGGVYELCLLDINFRVSLDDGFKEGFHL